ncbi:MAG: hypothetical protein P1R58_13795, partial [bacterium]|nr:hypothetical protein [bacterium]
LTRSDLTPDELWKERFHFTEDEFMLMQDARFERKPYFTISDIIDDPFAGGISAFGSITDSYYLPFMEGVKAHPESEEVSVSVLTVNSLGIVQCWLLRFKCRTNMGHTIELMKSPKEQLEVLESQNLERAIGKMLGDMQTRKRFRLFFNNEYYPALIPVRDKMVLLHKAVQTLIERGALNEKDREIVAITETLAPEWFVNSD